MRLPVSYLLDRLSPYLDDPLTFSADEDFPVDPPLFYSGERTLPRHGLYLARSEQLSKKPLLELGSFLLYSGPSLSLAPQNFFHLKDGITLTEISNELQKLFLAASRLEVSLNQAAYENAGPDRILSLAGEFLQKPLLLMTPEFHIMSRYIPPQITLSPEDLPVFPGALSPQIVNSLKNDEYYKAVETYTEPFLYAPSTQADLFCCINLLYDGIFIGRVILMEGTAPVRPWHNYFLKLPRHFLLPGYIKIWKRLEKQTDRSAFAAGLFEGIHTDAASLRMFLQDLSWTNEGPYLCVSIEPSEADIDNHTQTYFSREIESLIPSTVCAPVKNRIGLLCFIGDDASKRESFEQTLLYQVRESNFRIGISREFSGITNSVFAYRQADLALDYGMAEDPTLWTHTFDRAVLPYLLRACCRELPAEYVCHPAILTLRKTDAEKHSDYEQTLRMYLECGQNTALSAKRLFIHRGTMIYRLEHISLLTGIDLDSARERMYLMLSFALLDLENHEGLDSPSASRYYE